MGQKKPITGRRALGWVHPHKRRKRNIEMTNRTAATAATLSCVVASLFVAGPAHAAAMPVADPAPRASVGIADIDLASAAGRKLLNARVRMASAKICLSTNVEPVKVRAARKKCQRSAIAAGKREASFLVALRGDRSGQTAAGAI